MTIPAGDTTTSVALTELSERQRERAVPQASSASGTGCAACGRRQGGVAAAAHGAALGQSISAVWTDRADPRWPHRPGKATSRTGRSAPPRRRAGAGTSTARPQRHLSGNLPHTDERAAPRPGRAGHSAIPRSRRHRPRGWGVSPGLSGNTGPQTAIRTGCLPDGKADTCDAHRLCSRQHSRPGPGVATRRARRGGMHQGLRRPRLRSAGRSPRPTAGARLRAGRRRAGCLETRPAWPFASTSD